MSIREAVKEVAVSASQAMSFEFLAAVVFSVVTYGGCTLLEALRTDDRAGVSYTSSPIVNQLAER